MLVISDCHGQYPALRRLIEDKLPKIDNPNNIIFVGDLIDRGYYSPEVVQYVINNKYKCIRGNHEDFMIDFYESTNKYDPDAWFCNGGKKTEHSYSMSLYNPRHHVEWMKTLPYYIVKDNYFISHAPVPANKSPNQKDAEFDLMWNRSNPHMKIMGYPMGMKQVFGHNSHIGVKFFNFITYEENNGWYALCIDSTTSKKITAFDTDTNKIYQEDY
jgi:serine/threonine protein phosphatase 1